MWVQTKASSFGFDTSNSIIASAQQKAAPQLKCLLTIDDSHASAEDARLSTIHFLKLRVEEVEAENRKLK